MPRWDQDVYVQAWNFASQAHNGQKVPGSELPYLNHIGCVLVEVLGVLANEACVTAPNLLIPCAILHDTLEDTKVQFADIEQVFGLSVAKGVKALSKNQALVGKSLKMRDSLARIQCEPKEVWMVKMADRICNLQVPPQFWSKPKIFAYRLEAEMILRALGTASSYLSGRLSDKIAAYQQYEH